jgi:hypothetical protein
MSYTADQLAALEAAIAQGALIVEYAGKRVQYRSLAEMQAILRQMKVDAGVSSPSGRRYGEFSKGL